MCWSMERGICVLLTWMTWMTWLLGTKANEQVSPVTPGGIGDLCETETFRASCPEGQVIIMTHAHYGRMSVGRCVDRDYGYVGCYANVMTHMDALCSGRRKCELRIPDGMLDRVNQCPKDFKTYLETAYDCVKVKGIDCSQCRTGNHTLITSSEGFLAPPEEPPSGLDFPASEVTTLNADGCGSQRCTWRLRVPPGMTLNLTLWDFSLEDQGTDTDMGGIDACYSYASVWESPRAGETPVCGGLSRHLHVYSSLSNQVDVQLIKGRIRGQVPRFLLQYQAIGCADFKAPKNSNLERIGDAIIIRCTATGKSYHLKCENGEWNGSIGNCPKAGLQSVTTNSPTTATSHSTGLMVAIVIGIALVIGSFILTLGLILIKRRRNRHREGLHAHSAAYHTSLHSSKLYEGHLELSGSQGDMLGGRPCYQAVVHGKGNDYDYTMELRPLPSLPSMADGNHSNRICPQTSTTHAHCQCCSPYEGFHYGPEYNLSHPERPHSPLPPNARVVTVPFHPGMVPPHYFTLDPNQKKQLKIVAARQESCPVEPASPSTNNNKVQDENRHNLGKENRVQRKCSFHEASQQPGVVGELRNDSGTCSWP